MESNQGGAIDSKEPNSNCWTGEARFMDKAHIWPQILGGAVCIFALGLGLSGCSDNSSTDLAITRVPQTDPISPTVNQQIVMTFVVDNKSGDYSPSTTAAIRVDGSQVLSIPIDPIAGNSSRQIATSFSIGSAGAHSVSVVIDPSQTANDSNRDNNTFIFSVIVSLISST